MAIFPFFKKKDPVLLRCTECSYELDIPHKKVRSLIRQNKNDPVCTIKEPCHICHIGFMIPVNYTHSDGKQYLFDQLKPEIKNLDPDTAIDRIFEDANPGNIFFFGPDD